MDADPWLPLELLAAYNQIKTLPGTPLWQLVRYADTLDLFLGAMAGKGLGKEKGGTAPFPVVRVKEDLSRLWVLGDHLEYHFVPSFRHQSGFDGRYCQDGGGRRICGYYPCPRSILKQLI